MAVLADLPVDILLEILAYLEPQCHSKRDLLAVATTCRCLVAPARTYIYRNVQILVHIGDVVSCPTTKGSIGHPREVREHDKEHDKSNRHLFRRTIRENKRIRSLVKRVCVSFIHRPARPPAVSSDSGLLGILRALPNLKHLEISDNRFGMPAKANYFAPWPEIMLHDNLHDLIARTATLPLESYVLDLRSASRSMIAQVMISSTVKSVSVPRIWDTDNRHTSYWAWKPRLAQFLSFRLSAPSNLTRLDLGKYRIRPLHVEEILGFAPRLQYLKANVLGQGSCLNVPDYTIYEAERCLQPSRIVQALQPVQHTLEELDMVNDRYSWIGTNKTKADFRTFPKLRKIRVAPGLFFHWGAFGYGEHTQIDHGFVADHEDRRGLWELLPPNLKELEIYFHFDSGIFCVSNLHVSRLEARTEMAPEHYHWIKELATHKHHAFPSLQSVRLIEQVLTGSALGEGISFEEMDWTAPQDLLNAYVEADIDLKIQLRSNHRKKAAETKPCCAVASAYGRSCCTDLN